VLVTGSRFRAAFRRGYAMRGGRLFNKFMRFKSNSNVQESAHCRTRLHAASALEM